MKTWGSTAIAPQFLTLALDGVEWSVSHTALCLRGKSLRYPLDRMLRRPQSRVWTLWSKQKPLVPTENRTRPSNPQLVGITAEVSRLNLISCKVAIVLRFSWFSPLLRRNSGIITWWCSVDGHVSCSEWPNLDPECVCTVATLMSDVYVI
jgi:hypothetical protein